MKTIHHLVEIDAPAAEVHAALTSAEGLSSWWTSVGVDAPAPPSVGDVVTLRFVEGRFNPEMTITELVPGKLLSWRCSGGHDPWADNDFRFEISDDGEKQSRLRFWQHYATELDDDAYGTYNYNWGYYLDSLRLHCESGEGKPFAG